jgi:hypothetical protein
MKNHDHHAVMAKRGGPPVLAFMATYVGALIYFIDKANGFWEVVLAFLQAAVWPAYLINKIFTLLQIQ